MILFEDDQQPLSTTIFTNHIHQQFHLASHFPDIDRIASHGIVSPLLSDWNPIHKHNSPRTLSFGHLDDVVPSFD